MYYVFCILAFCSKYKYFALKIQLYFWQILSQMHVTLVGKVDTVHKIYQVLNKIFMNKIPYVFNTNLFFFKDINFVEKGFNARRHQSQP